MWLNRFFDRHFHPTAYRRYGKVYTKRKTKRKNERPLFDTGEMMQRLKLSATVTSTSKKATLTMRGPWWVRAYKKAGLDKVAELTAVSRGEVRELARFIGRRIPVLMRRERGTRITRTR